AKAAIASTFGSKRDQIGRIARRPRVKIGGAHTYAFDVSRSPPQFLSAAQTPRRSRPDQEGVKRTVWLLSSWRPTSGRAPQCLAHLRTPVLFPTWHRPHSRQSMRGSKTMAFGR